MADRRTDPGQYYPGGKVWMKPSETPPQVDVDWANVKNKPDTFPPSAHGHPDISAAVQTAQNTANQAQTTANTAQTTANAVKTLVNDSIGVTDADNGYDYETVGNVREYASRAAFPETGEEGVCYVAQDTGDRFRWMDTVNPETEVRYGYVSLVEAGIAIGDGAHADGRSVDGKNQAIAIGRQASVTGTYGEMSGASVAIGSKAKVDTCEQAIVIGREAKALNKSISVVAIGSRAEASGVKYSVAVGHAAKVAADGSVQLGEGICNTALTLQFRGTKIVQNGKILSGNLDETPAQTKAAAVALAVPQAVAQAVPQAVQEAVPQAVAQATPALVDHVVALDKSVQYVHGVDGELITILLPTGESQGRERRFRVVIEAAANVTVPIEYPTSGIVCADDLPLAAANGIVVLTFEELEDGKYFVSAEKAAVRDVMWQFVGGDPTDYLTASNYKVNGVTPPRGPLLSETILLTGSVWFPNSGLLAVTVDRRICVANSGSTVPSLVSDSVTLNGEVYGNGDLEIMCPATFAHDNSSFSGRIANATGFVQPVTATRSHALGTGPVNLSGGCYVKATGSITLDNDFTFTKPSGTSPINVVSGHSSVTLAGKVDVSGCHNARIRGTATYNGELKLMNTLDLAWTTSGKYNWAFDFIAELTAVFNGRITNYGVIYCDSRQANWTFNHSNNEIDMLWMQGTETITVNANDAFDGQTVIVFDNKFNSQGKVSTVNFNCDRVTIGGCRDRLNTAGAGDPLFRIVGNGNTDLTVVAKESDNRHYYVGADNMMGLKWFRWKPTGNYTCRIAAPYPELCLEVAGGSVTMFNGLSLDEIAITGSGKTGGDAGPVYVNRLTVNGEQMPSGTYTPEGGYSWAINGGVTVR